MNLLITKSCNRSCPYCFAQDKVRLDATHSSGNITLSAFKKYLTFLKCNGISDLKLLGGEPSMHPQLIELLEIALAQNFIITIFTNGLWSEDLRSYFQENKNNNIHFLININEEQYSSKNEHFRLAKTLEILGEQAMFGFNIFVKNFDLTFMQPLIETYGLKRTIRLGLASPIVGENNLAIHTHEIKTIGKRLIEQMNILESHNVIVAFDCGFTYCMFDEKDYPTLIRATENGLVSVCDFIGDVDCNLDVWPCFPLSKTEQVNLQDFEYLSDIKDHYRKRFQAIRYLGSTDDCLSCNFLRRAQCCGGCMARSIETIIENGDQTILSKLSMDQ